jgi:membrane fusion protein, multidrug efflux system
MRSILTAAMQQPVHSHNPGWNYYQPIFNLLGSVHIPKVIRGVMFNINRRYLIGALLAMLMLYGCSDNKKTAPPPLPPKVVAVPVLQQTVPIIMQFPGTVKGNRKVVIKPQISGYIEQFLFTEGSQVKAGDVLYQIDPRPFQAQLHAAEAQLMQNQASLSFWTLEVERFNQLLKKDFVSKERRDSAVTKKKEFAAATDKDKADIEQAKLDLGYTRIVAPFAGWIQETQVYKGAVVTAQQTELTTLTSLNPVYVDFYISRRNAYTIQELSVSGLGPQKRSDMTGLLTLPDGTIYSEQGHVDYSSASFNPGTDTMAARAIFANQSIDHKHLSGLALKLIPGQYALLNLTVGKLPDALLIPQTALLETQQGSFVYVLAKDNTVAKRMVTKGSSYKQYWVIKAGLKKDETVISQGLQKIRKSGMQVQPIKPAAK